MKCKCSNVSCNWEGSDWLTLQGLACCAVCKGPVTPDPYAEDEVKTDPTQVRATFKLFTKDQQEVLVALINKWEHIIPPWPKTLWVEYASEGCQDGTIMRISMDVPYRSATIYVYPSFFETDIDPWAQERYLIHELLHLVMEPPTKWAFDNLKRLLPDAERYQETVVKELVDRIEGCIQDLATGLIDENRARK